MKELSVQESTLIEALRHAAKEKAGELRWLKYPIMEGRKDRM